LNGMKFNEVRFVGNKKFKDKKKLPDGQEWEQLSSWPDELKAWFKASSGVEFVSSMPVPPTPPSEPAPVESAAPAEPPPDPRVTGARTPAQAAAGLTMEPTVSPHTPYEYRLTAPLTIGTIEKLAYVILKCRGRGTNLLRLISKDNVPLDDLTKHSPFDGNPILVNHREFHYLAQEHGL